MLHIQHCAMLMLMCTISTDFCHCYLGANNDNVLRLGANNSQSTECQSSFLGEK